MGMWTITATLQNRFLHFISSMYLNIVLVYLSRYYAFQKRDSAIFSDFRPILLFLVAYHENDFC